MFVVALLLLVVAIVAAIVLFATPNRRSLALGVTGIAGVLAVGMLFFTSFYTNDEGQAKVIRSFTGEVQGQVTEAGAGFHAPWQDTISYDIRNQQVVFAGTENDEVDLQGSQVTVQDREGVSANIDISVRYSIKPDAVSAVYKQYGSQENFISKFIVNDIRAGVRTVPTAYGTLDLLNSRAKVEKEITDYLEQRWTSKGVLVDSVSLQEIRYPEDVQKRFADAQNARTEVEKAKAELEATEVSAKQKIVQAEAESEANRKLAESLTDPVLKQRYLDTLKELGKGGNLVVVPDGFNGLVNVSK
ncbi:prohibitin family protein [Mycetocola saprophilus]|uniref:prohibitin family protein n=1 Tax=Mycetocola saprophilus TaxID=76636 RepID=UPI00068CF05A|nr:prohibitin family protein [Mycetocola saprophilus]